MLITMVDESKQVFFTEKQKRKMYKMIVNVNIEDTGPKCYAYFIHSLF